MISSSRHCLFLVAAALLLPQASASASSSDGAPPALAAVETQQMQRQVIVNGQESNERRRSFFARAGYDDFPQTSEIICGATLISRDIAVSAAHCQGAFNHGIRILDPTTGDFDRLVEVSAQSRHPGWDEDQSNLNFDILVLKLKTPLAANDVAQPIPYNTDPNYPAPGQNVLSMGFGLTESQTVSNDLLEAEMKYISNDECWSRSIQFNNVQKGAEVMCTDPIDGSSTCLGDSGGPLTNADGTRLLGIVSFGSGCNADDIPDGYVRMSAMADWTFQQICELSDNPPSNCPPTGRNNLDVKMALYFDHDFFSDQTTFAVRERSSKKVVFAGPRYTPERGESVKSEFYLAPGDYTFEVYDTDSNGLISEGNGDNGSWYLAALYDDATEDRVASGGPWFGRKDEIDFRVEAPSRPGPSAPEDPPLEVPKNEDPVSPAYEACLVQRAAEDIAGELFGTTCDCDEDNGKLSCRNGNGQSCKPLNEQCVIDADCCSGRRCRANLCRKENGTVGREDSKLGREGSTGGAAGRRQGGRLRGRTL